MSVRASSPDAVASRLSARQKITAAVYRRNGAHAAVYRRNGAHVSAGQMARALELAVAWAQVADERRITLEDLAGTSADLSTIAVDAVLNHDRRLSERVAPS